MTCSRHGRRSPVAELPLYHGDGETNGRITFSFVLDSRLHGASVMETKKEMTFPFLSDLAVVQRRQPLLASVPSIVHGLA